MAIRRSIYELDQNLYSPFTLSILEENYQSRDFLIEIGVNPLKGAGKFESTLHLSVAKLDFIACQIIINYVEKKEKTLDGDSKGDTPLHILFANFSKNLKNAKEIANFILEKEADPNILNETKWSPLHIAIQNFQLKAVEFANQYNNNNLINSNKNLKCFNFNKKGGESFWSCLHLASNLGFFEFFEILFDNCDIFYKDANGKTAKDIATSILIVKFLVKKEKSLLMQEICLKKPDITNELKTKKSLDRRFSCKYESPFKEKTKKTVIIDSNKRIFINKNERNKYFIGKKPQEILNNNFDPYLLGSKIDIIKSEIFEIFSNPLNVKIQNIFNLSHFYEKIENSLKWKEFKQENHNNFTFLNEFLPKKLSFQNKIFVLNLISETIYEIFLEICQSEETCYHKNILLLQLVSFVNIKISNTRIKIILANFLKNYSNSNQFSKIIFLEAIETIFKILFLPSKSKISYNEIYSDFETIPSRNDKILQVKDNPFKKFGNNDKHNISYNESNLSVGEESPIEIRKNNISTHFLHDLNFGKISNKDSVLSENLNEEDYENVVNITELIQKYFILNKASPFTK